MYLTIAQEIRSVKKKIPKAWKKVLTILEAWSIIAIVHKLGKGGDNYE